MTETFHLLGAPQPDDMTTEDAGEWFAEHLKSKARELFNRHGNLRRMAVMIARRHPEAGTPLTRVWILPVVIQADDLDGAAEAVRELAKTADAIGVGMLSEARRETIEIEDGTEPPPADLSAQSLADSTNTDGPDGDHFIVVSWQHRATGCGGAAAEIIETGARPILGPWHDLNVIGGRLVEFLPKGNG